ncbi:MAG: hypothetical protein ABI663_01010 [Chryseolinea sp.]
MKMKKSFIIVAMILSFAWTTQAQGNLFYLDWDINVPTHNRDWLNATSVKGAKIGYRKFLNRDNNRFSLGIDFGWTTYDQYVPTRTFENATGAITTDYFKYIYQKSLVLSGQYYFKVGELDWLYPYAGLGLGAARNKYRIFYNIYAEGNDSWGFLARPEAGILLRFQKKRSIGVMAAVHYDINTSQNKDYNYNYFSSVGFQLGIVLMTWY